MATKIKNVTKNINVNQAANSVNGTTTVTKNTIYNDVFSVANDVDYVEIAGTNNKSSDTIYLQGVNPQAADLEVYQEYYEVEGNLVYTKNLIISYINKYGTESKVVVKNYFSTEEGISTNSTIKKIRVQNPSNPSKTIDYNLTDYIAERANDVGIINGNTITGSVFGDYITSLNSEGMNVNAGAGDDYIESGLGNDTITGGAGKNRIYYDSNSKEDTIYLTKGEELIIDYRGVCENPEEFLFTKSGNDIIITKEGTSAKIIIKNALKSGAKSVKFEAHSQGRVLTWDILNGGDYIASGEYDGDSNTIFYNHYNKKNVNSKGVLNASSTADEIILADYTNKKKTGVKVNAGAGNDSIVSSEYNDTINAGAGNDTVIALGGNNKIYGEGGDDEIHISSEKGNNYIDGGAGNDYLTGAKGNDTIKGGAGNDTISEWAGKNVLYGGAGNDYISGGEGNDKMYGDAGNDTIFSYSGNDTIYAGAGNDRIEVITGKNTIYAQKGNNTIYGGEGSDKIYAGSGNDKIYYCVGGGKDTIYNATSKTTLAIYDSNVDLNMRDLTFVKKGNDLIIALKAQGNADGTLKYSDSITIANYYKSKNKISNIEILGRYRNYLPYSEQTLANLMKNQGVYQVGNKVTGINGITNVIVGTSKNDTLNGGNSMDIFAGGKGNDIIKGGKGTTLVQYRAGDGNDTIQLTKGETVQIMYTLDAGTDISSMDEDDIINMFSIKEIGKDVIISRKWNNNGKTVTDKIIIKNMTLNNLAQDITMGICDSTNHEITSIDLLEKQYLLQGKASYNKKTKKYSGATVNGTNLNEEIVGTDYADTIKAGSGEDVIIGGKGNDKLYGGAGENLYQINKNDGNDIIYTASGNNIINFNYGTADDYKIERKGNDVIISAKDPNQKNTVTIKDYFKTNKDNVLLDFHTGDRENLKDIMQGIYENDYGWVYIDKSSLNKKQTINGTLLDEDIRGSKAGDIIKSAGGENYIAAGAGNDTIYGGNGCDAIYGEAGNDLMISGNGEMYYGFSINHGNDTIDAKKGENIINFNSLELKDLTFTKKGNDVIITNKNSKGKNETVTIKNYVKNGKNNVYITGDGFNADLIDIINKKIEGANVTSNNTINKSKATKKQNINATFLDETITGSKYNDTIKAAAGNDVVKAGKGNDIIYAGAGNDTIYGDAGNDKIYAQQGNNVIDGGAGNDTIYAGKGYDRILHKAGQGKDVIYNITSNTSIEISGVEDEDSVAYIKSGNDLIIATDAEWNLSYTDFTYKSSVTVKNYFKFENQHIGLSITSKDGYPFEPTYLDWEMEDNDLKISGKGKINGLDGTNDMLIGSNKNDTITIAQHSYINTIEAGKGNDVIKTASYTNNSIFYNQGDGNDTIYVTNNTNIHLFYTSTDKKPLNESDFKFTQSGDDLIITRSYKITTKNSKGKKITKTVTDKITLKNGANPEIIANIIFYAATKDQIENGEYDAIYKILTGNDGGNPYLADYGLDKTFYASVIDKNTSTEAQEIMGTDINDYIVGSDYNDKIYAGEGVDYIEAGKGDDTIIVRQNQTDSDKIIKIKNGDGNDTIKGAGSELEGSELSPAQKPKLTLAFDTGTTLFKQVIEKYDGRYNIILHKFYLEDGVQKHEATTLTDISDTTKIGVKLGDDNPIDLDSLTSLPENFVFDGTTDIMQLEPVGTTITGGQNVLVFGSSDDDNVVIDNTGGTTNIIDSEGDNSFNIKNGTNNISTNDGDDNITISGGTNGITTGDGEDNFTISGGTNTINTGDDNDEVSITGGTNTITGGYGFVETTIEGGTNTINAATDHTYIKASITAGNNTIDSTRPSSGNVSTYANITLQGGTNSFTGGSQRDFVKITGGNNTINTGAEKDRISIEGGTTYDSNNIDAGEGNDEIYIDGGLHNTVNGGAGNDDFHITGGTNTINGGADADTFSITGGINTIDGNAGADDYIIDNGTNTINDTGIDAANKFNISGGTNDITTSATNNENYTITGGTNNIARSGSITANISGSSTNTTIYAATGSVTATSGTNTIYARAGVAETAQGGNIGATISGGKASFYANENDNYANTVSITGGSSHDINTGGGNDSIYIKTGAAAGNNYNSGSGADTINFIGGAYNYAHGGTGNDTFNIGTNDTTTGGSSNIFYGDAGDDKFVIKRGSHNTYYGDDENDSLTGNDKFTIEGGIRNSIYAGKGNDQISITGGTESYINAGNGNDEIIVGSEARYTTIEGGAGDDNIIFSVFSTNSASLNFNNGDGHDTINILPDNSTLYFDDVNNFSDFAFDYDVSNLALVIKYNQRTEGGVEKFDSVTIQKYLGENINVVCKEGTSELFNLIAEQYSEGTDGDDILIANAGSPTTLGAGKDKVLIMKNANYTITPGTDAQEDTIVFTNVNSISGLTAKLGATNSLNETDAVISYKINNINYEVTVTNYKNTTNKVIKLQTKDGQTISLNDLIHPVYNGNDATVSGSAFDDNITVTYTGNLQTSILGNDGNDTIVAGSGSKPLKIYGGNGNDSIVGSSGKDYIDSGADNDTVRAGAGNDEIHTSGGNNLLCGDEGNDYIWASHGNDTIYGGSGNDNISGQKGNDIIFAQDGNDTISSGSEGNKVYDGGTGHDSINGGKDNDTIYGGTGSDTISGKDGNDIIYGYGSAEPYYDTLTGTFTYQEITNESDRIELKAGIVDSLDGGNGDDTIYAGATKNILTGGKGNDVIYGYSGGGNTFLITANVTESQNDGEDIIYTGYGDSANADIIKFTGVSDINDITFNLSFNGVDAILTYCGTGKITIKNFLKYSDNKYNLNATTIWLEDNNGNRIRLTDLYEASTTYNHVGTVFPDIMASFTSGTLTGGAGDDIIMAADGSDIAGEEGANTYKVFLSPLDSELETTTIHSTSGKDIIEFSTLSGTGAVIKPITPTSYSYTKDGNHLMISYTIYDKTLTLKIKDYFINPVDITLRTADGDMSLYDQIKNVDFGTVKFGSGTYNSYSYQTAIGTHGNDSITFTGSYNVTAFGGDGNDTITGGTGIDTLCGGLGADSISGGNSGVNYIYGTTKDKIDIVSSNNTDILTGGNNRDYFYVYGENASIQGGEGDDCYEAYLSNKVLINDTAGKDTIVVTNPSSHNPLTVDDVRFAFSGTISKDSNGTLTMGDSGKFYIFSAESYEKWKSGVSANSLDRIELDSQTFNADINTTNGIKVYLNEGKSNTYASWAEINAFMQDVVGWIESSGYGSINNILSRHNNGEIDASALIAKFDNFHMYNHS